MAVKDEWVPAAMNDDGMVVHLLLRLKQATPTKRAVATLRWGIRQPRSRATLIRCGGDFSTRCSPTTPFSWGSGGGATSPSAAEGFEATSRPLPSRSKGIAVDETINTKSKRTRRKKTLAELKEEENLLLKERIYLQKEIASMHATCREQRARNQHLKRIKLDSNSHVVKNSSLVADEPKNHCFRLPDLNMMPGENDSDTETRDEVKI